LLKHLAALPEDVKTTIIAALTLTAERTFRYIKQDIRAAFMGNRQEKLSLDS